MPSRVRLIPSLIQDELGSLLHGQINSLLPRSSNFLNSILLTLKHLPCLHNMTTRFFHHEGIYSIVRFYRVLWQEESPLICNTTMWLEVSLTLRWLMLLPGIVCHRVDRSKCRILFSCPRVVRIYHAMRVTWSFTSLVICGHEYKFSQIIIRLRQVKRFWLLASIVATAPLRFKNVFFWRIEVVWVVVGAIVLYNWTICGLRSGLQVRPQAWIVFCQNGWGALRHIHSSEFGC